MGQRTGQFIGETLYAAENRQEALVLEEGFEFECEERVFTVAEVNGGDDVIVSSEFTGGD